MSVLDADTVSFVHARPRLFGIARRVLGSAAEADDVVQEAWIRWQESDRSVVRDPAAFLATTTTRLALNVGQSARVRHETDFGPRLVDVVDPAADPVLGAERREALEVALRTVLERLSATERAVYVLREAFDYPHRRIAEVVGLSEANARQLVTRARRRIAGAPRWTVDPVEQSGWSTRSSPPRRPANSPGSRHSSSPGCHERPGSLPRARAGRRADLRRALPLAVRGPAAAARRRARAARARPPRRAVRPRRRPRRRHRRRDRGGVAVLRAVHRPRHHRRSLAAGASRRPGPDPQLPRPAGQPRGRLRGRPGRRAVPVRQGRSRQAAARARRAATSRATTRASR